MPLNQPDELNLNLDIPTLMRACKGNVENLPTFMVHNDEVWPAWRKTMLDTKNRIHIRRTTFMQTVARSLPVRPGLWLRIDTQQFHIDLQPHHLQGTTGMQKVEGHKHSRELVQADEDGQVPGEWEYGKNRKTVAERDGREGPSLADITDARRRAERRRSGFVNLVH